MKKSVAKTKGTLTVIAGPMYSGKTTKLITIAHILQTLGKKCLVVKPSVDTRFGKDHHIQSHDGKTIDAILLAKDEPQTIVSKSKHYDALLIDEVQFFETDLMMNAIVSVLHQGKDVYVSGLQYDFRRMPFATTEQLLGIADHILLVKSICQKCGGIATHSERIAGSTKQVDVGASDKYIAACTSCHQIYTKNTA